MKAPPPLLTCSQCGTDRNSRGVVFTAESLGQHVRKCRAAGGQGVPVVKPDKALTCEICGAWRSRRGKVFESATDLQRHIELSHGDTHPAPLGNGAHPARRRSRNGSAAIELKFCPCCGCNLEVVAAALSFVP